jgi:hypothetical protein
MIGGFYGRIKLFSCLNEFVVKDLRLLGFRVEMKHETEISGRLMFHIHARIPARVMTLDVDFPRPLGFGMWSGSVSRPQVFGARFESIEPVRPIDFHNFLVGKIQ